jgi:dTDP-4-dehydrorhamnose 3,5-epimerase
MTSAIDRNTFIPLDPKEPRRHIQTVDPSGRSVLPRIQGVEIRELVTHPDARGSVCELYDLRWDHHPDPMVFSYVVTIRPNVVKGWNLHHTYDDRSAFFHGAIQMVLWDAREDSPTHNMINDFTFGAERRALVTIPRGVWHALRNVHTEDSMFVNYPTSPYNHQAPDKELLPVENNIVPYKFR